MRTQKWTKLPRTKSAVDYPAPAIEGLHRVLLSGDTHGDANHVRWLLEEAQRRGAQALYVLGDFGVWDHLDQGKFTDFVSKWSQRLEVSTFFLPGNHENYDLLFDWEATKPRTADGFLELKPGLFYSPRGHRWEWGGVRFMSLGGAYSVDKQHRVLSDHLSVLRAEKRRDKGLSSNAREATLLRTGQWSWWAQEEISQEELDYALRPGEVDILLTHDKPRLAKPDWDRKDLPECWENQEAIQEVLDAKRPKLLMHGHLHWPYDQRLPTGTLVKALDCDPEASKYSGGTGMKSANIAVLDLPEDGRFKLTWSGNTFDGWSDTIERAFEVPVLEA